MQIVGHKLSKISGDKSGTIAENKSMTFDIKLSKVELREIFPGLEQSKGLAFDFSFVVKYGKASNLAVEGAIFGNGSEDEIKSLAKDWKKSPDTNIEAAVKNRIMALSIAKLVSVAESLNLPLPIKYPGKFVPGSGTKK